MGHAQGQQRPHSPQFPPAICMLWTGQEFLGNGDSQFPRAGRKLGRCSPPHLKKPVDRSATACCDLQRVHDGQHRKKKRAGRSGRYSYVSYVLHENVGTENITTSLKRPERNGVTGILKETITTESEVGSFSIHGNFFYSFRNAPPREKDFSFATLSLYGGKAESLCYSVIV